MVKYIGIDIGGTNIRVGAIDEQENVIFSYKERTLKDVITPEDLYNKIKELIKKVPNYTNSKAIGIGSPGYIDEKIGEVVHAKNLPLIVGMPLTKRLREEFKVPVYIKNDAQIATVAEAIKGAGTGKEICCYITISTGVGGGIAIDGKIFDGATNVAGSFGKMILDEENNANDLISGKALIKQVKEKMNVDIDNASKVFEFANQGNVIAKNIVEQFKKRLVILLLNISTTINPNIIVLGGGVLKSKQYFLQEVIEEFTTKANQEGKNTIITTALLEEPGIVGAALIAKIKETL